MEDEELRKTPEARKDEAPSLDVPVDSPAIRRLVEEVRAEEVEVSRAYNRTYNRHNR